MDTQQAAVSHGLALVSIPVQDQDKAKQFYAEVLGFPVVREASYRPDARWIELEIPGTNTNITLVTWFPSMPAGSLRGLVLIAEDVAAAFETLQSRGLETSPVESAPWGKYLTFSDPDGNGWVLNEARRAA
jgi:catechol 2,3-dioxygenase-like lactoylglutathione lyase family enzyme